MMEAAVGDGLRPVKAGRRKPGGKWLQRQRLPAAAFPLSFMLITLSYRLKRLNRSILARLSLLAPQLGVLGATPNPVLRLEYPAQQKNRTLLVFLPGIGDLAEDFERHGFIEDLRRHRIAADAVAIDLHFGYYATKSIGISLGAFGAASYAARHATAISGIALLAPYLGDKTLIDEIGAAGGVRHWEPGETAPHDHTRQLWSWLKQHALQKRDAFPVYIGYGKSDKFARANELLAQALPAERVFAISGRHNWQTWKRLWHLFLVQWGRQRR
jgi:pimeloyl-ACP methyl ester carboxylesterase